MGGVLNERERRKIEKKQFVTRNRKNRANMVSKERR